MREEVRRLKRGRPKASDPVRVVRKSAWSLRVKVDDAALRAECRADGVFPLGTNLDKASKRQVLEIYKYQPYVEKRFSQIKTDLEVAPVYLKKPLRCAGLVHAYYGPRRRGPHRARRASGDGAGKNRRPAAVS